MRKPVTGVVSSGETETETEKEAVEGSRANSRAMCPLILIERDPFSAMARFTGHDPGILESCPLY